MEEKPSPTLTVEGWRYPGKWCGCLAWSDSPSGPAAAAATVLDPSTPARVRIAAECRQALHRGQRAEQARRPRVSPRLLQAAAHGVGQIVLDRPHTGNAAGDFRCLGTRIDALHFTGQGHYALVYFDLDVLQLRICLELALDVLGDDFVIGRHLTALRRCHDLEFVLYVLDTLDALRDLESGRLCLGGVDLPTQHHDAVLGLYVDLPALDPIISEEGDLRL